MKLQYMIYIALMTGFIHLAAMKPELKQKTLKPEVTCALIKPDAVAAGHTGAIIEIIELNGFIIKELSKKQLTKKQAESFYAVHKDRPFFSELVTYMTSGPIVIMALEKENAIAEWRTLMGSTDPKTAIVGTIRKMFGTSKTMNASHGSDSVENAQIELALFFPSAKQ